MFESREQAGEFLAKKLEQYRGNSNILVLGIPRGGVVVAKVVAKGLGAPLDAVVVKKIGAPDNPELAIGAVGPQGCVYWDKKLIRSLGVDRKRRNQILKMKNQEREEREKLLRGKKTYANVQDKIVIIVDDGVATGATAIVASLWVKKMDPEEIILAIPVIAKDTLSNISRYFDRIIFLEQPEEFYAVGEFYHDFPQVSDKEVVEILRD